MNRGFWFVAGAGAGVYAMLKARRAAEALTPDGIGDRLAGLSLGLHLLGEDVRRESAVKQTELRERLGLDGSRELTAAASHPHPTHPPELTREGND